MYTCQTLNSIPHIAHGFFGRKGGVSDGLYASLNCGYGSGDDIEKVRQNRAIVTQLLGTDAELLTCFQIHSPIVVTVNAPWEWKHSPEADAMVTNKPGIPLGVLAADCLMVLFADTQKPIIAAAHSGWKGSFGGVLEATLSAMKQLGADNIVATIGPCISQQSYEVGPEFYARFMQADAANSVYFLPTGQGEARSGGDWGEGPQQKYKFNLPEYARARLIAAGVAKVERLAYDTCSLEEEFFSYRRATLRAESAYGRQVGAIMIK